MKLLLKLIAGIVVGITVGSLYYGVDATGGLETFLTLLARLFVTIETLLGGFIFH